ncbi:hydroxyacid dehydrogenase [bacterium]|nr:hydroxyacid dehydrogenase [bacterium]|tara:strand:- start:4302 stop:5312 length:1011 start_codon:yes stop_codon:yes gene_type:complete
MHLLYLRPYTGEADIVRELLPADITLSVATDVEELSSEARAEVTAISVFVDFEITAEILEQFPNLTFIATRSAGFDHIDIAAATARNIVVSRVPHYGTRTVAEFAIALMFALSRNAFRAYTDMLQRSAISELECYEGFDLAGKTLGVVGTGAIGRNVCQIARGIGMEVMAYDINPDQEFATAAGVTYDTLEAVLASSDIVTLHVPAMPQTHHLINAERLSQMKPGAYLVNTARGEVVDTQALLSALESDHLAGAGLDVLEGEHALREEVDLLRSGQTDPELWQTLVADHSLIDMPNVIVTPHIAFNTKEAKREITEITIDNVKAFIAGSPQRVVEA